MFGLGTVINTAAIIVGGIVGLLFGRFLQESHQETLTRVCGVCVLFIGIAGALEGMLTVEGARVTSGKSMLVIACLALGALLGEMLNLEDKITRFGEWLKIKTGSARDRRFVEGFVTASLTVCIGAMAVVGAIEDALAADISILVTKAILDFIIIMVMTCSIGKGCIFSAVPVFLFQGSITCLAHFIKPLMTEAALANLSLIGAVLIFCVGINLVWEKRIRVANLLPSIVFAVGAAFLPL